MANDTQLLEIIESARTESNMPGLRAAIRLPNGQIIRAASG